MRWYPLDRKECRTVVTSKGAWLLVPLIILWVFTRLTQARALSTRTSQSDMY